MPQGKSKLNAAKQSSGGKKKVADKKKGLRAIPPKNKQTVRQATQHKVSLRIFLAIKSVVCGWLSCMTIVLT